MSQQQVREIKAVAVMATMYSRRHQAAAAVRSLHKQVDRVTVILNIINGDCDISQWKRDIMKRKKADNVRFVISDNRLGDAERYRPVTRSAVYYFSCDDDLIYPPTYVEKMVQGIETYRAPVTLHGKYVPKGTTFTNFYQQVSKLGHCFHCLGSQDDDYEVTIPGTGVMAWRGDHIDLTYDQFNERNMADIEVARLAYQQRQRIVCLAHDNNYLTYNDVGDETIWNWHYNDCERQTEIVNAILTGKIKRGRAVKFPDR